MAQQTAVEWLHESNIVICEMLLYGKIGYRQYEQLINCFSTNLEQAKQMEKEQIIESWKHGKLPTFLGRVLTAEEYYNETYTQGSE